MKFTAWQLKAIRNALHRAIDWNLSLIEAHTPQLKYRGQGPNSWAAYIRTWKKEIVAWEKFLREIQNEAQSKKQRQPKTLGVNS